MGVKVIAAHVASSGYNIDLESSFKKPTSSFKLFRRLYDDPKYKNNLFTDLAALSQAQRAGAPLLAMLDNPEYHSRICTS